MNYQNSKTHLTEALVEDMAGNVAMTIFLCWILDAGQSIESMLNHAKITSLQTSQCLSVTQIPGHDLILAKNATGHTRLLDFPTFKQNVLSNLGLSITIETSTSYRMLIWTGSELRFSDVEAPEMVIGYSNPSVRLAQEIYKASIKKESEILQQLQALKLFAESHSPHQKRGLLFWIFSTDFGNKICKYLITHFTNHLHAHKTTFSKHPILHHALNHVCKS